MNTFGTDIASSILGTTVQNQQNGMGNLTGGVSGGFNNVLNQFSSGIQQNAATGGQLGIGAGANMTPDQIAAQIQHMGVGSIVPFLGNKFLPKLIMPMAGVFSMVNVLRQAHGMYRDIQNAPKIGFDSADLQYNKVSASLETGNWEGV